MGEGPLNSERWEATPVFWHVVALLLIVLFVLWLRPMPLQADPALQGYLQVVTALLAFVFSAVTLVRFQGTQDRISLILGAAFCSPAGVADQRSLFQPSGRVTDPLGAGCTLGWPIDIGAVAGSSAARRTFSATFTPTQDRNCWSPPQRRRAHLYRDRNIAPFTYGGLRAPWGLHSVASTTLSWRDFPHSSHLVPAAPEPGIHRFRPLHLCGRLDESRRAACG